MKRLARLLSLLLLLPLLFSCHGSHPEDTEAAAPPSRVAVLFSSLAEVWQEAGGRVAITVGESVTRGLVPPGTPLVDGGAGKTINEELLLSYRPDLVVYSPDIPAQVKAAATAEKAGIATLALRVESFSDYGTAIRMATAVTKNTEAVANCERLAAEIEEILTAKRPEIEGKTLLFIRAGQTAASTKAKRGEDHFAAAMLGELGLCNIAEEAPLLLDTLSTEAILAADPDYIFFSLMGDEEGARANVNTLLSRPEWQALTAVKEGRAFILPRALFHYKPCARWGEAYRYLIDALEEEMPS